MIKKIIGADLASGVVSEEKVNTDAGMIIPRGKCYICEIIENKKKERKESMNKITTEKSIEFTAIAFPGGLTKISYFGENLSIDSAIKLINEKLGTNFIGMSKEIIILNSIEAKGNEIIVNGDIVQIYSHTEQKEEKKEQTVGEMIRNEKIEELEEITKDLPLINTVLQAGKKGKQEKEEVVSEPKPILNVSEYIAIDKQIKELEAKREKMKPEIIAYMQQNKLKTLSKLTLIGTIKRKLDVTKVYKFLGFKKFMTIAKVTTKDTEQYLSKLDIGKCYEDKEVNPEYSLRINHNGNT